MEQDLNNIFSTIRDLEKVPDKTYYFLLVVLIIYGVNLWIRNLKGRKTYPTQFIDTLKNLIKYFLNEKDGNVVQKINAALGFVILLLVIAVLFLFSFDYYVKSKLSITLLIIIISGIISLFVALPICAKYTRHRY